MYKHTVDSIKETDNKVFVSAEEKKKFNTYQDRFTTIEHTYSRDELDTFISDLQVKDVTVEGEVIMETNTTPSIITNIELYGNTKQVVNEIVINPVLEPGSVSSADGTLITGTENELRSNDFIEVKYLDSLSYYNDDIPRNYDVFAYDKDKTFLKNINFSDTGENFVINDDRIKYIIIHHWTNNSDNVKLVIKRTDFANMQSVGELLPEGKYIIKIHSTSKNIFDITSKSEIGYINDLGTINHENLSWVHHDYLPIPETGKITVSETSNNFYQYKVAFYDRDKNFIGCDGYTGHYTKKYTCTVPKGSAFYKLSYSIRVSGNYVTRENIQVEIGDEMTEYTEYSKSTSEILLPVQLERIGDVTDRLFKRDDGVWCIEKNIATVTLDGTEDTDFIERTYVAPYRRFAIKLNNLLIGCSDKLSVISNRLPSFPFGVFYNNDTIVGISNVNNVNDLSIRLHETSLPANTTGGESIKEWLKTNNLTVKYVLNDSNIIELPLDVQISLNTFYNETKIFTESGSNTGNIKVTIPKSLGSSIDSLLEETNNVSKSIKNIKKTATGQTVSYSSNKGFINLTDTNSGVIDDITIEGQTLFNLLPQDWKGNYTYGDTNHVVGTEKDYIRRSSLLVQVKPNTVYTVIATVVKNTLQDGQFFVLVDKHLPGDYIASKHVKISNGFKGLFVAKFTSNEVIEDRTVQKSYLRTQTSCTNPGVIEIRDMMIIEGDHTDKPLSYFEGIKSVGDGVDNIKLKSSKRNILDLLKYTPVINGNPLVMVSLEEYDSNKIHLKTLPGNAHSYPSVWFNDVEFIPGRTYRVKAKVTKSDPSICPIFSIRASHTYGTPHKDIRESNGMIDGTFVPTNRVHRIEFFAGNQVGKIDNTEALFDDIQITLEDECEYTTPHVNEKNLYYIDNDKNLSKIVLRSLPNGLKDYVKKHENGKYYYHKVCEEIILDGSEVWKCAGPDTEFGNESYSLYGCQSSYTTFKNVGKHKSLGICMSNRLPTGERVSSVTYNAEAIGLGANIDIRLKNERFDTISEQNIKDWLNANPLTLVYELNTPEVYECVDLSLNLYEHSGTILCESGSLFPKITVSVATFIGNVLCNIKDRVSKLEDTLYQKYLFRNKMMLQNMYKSDNTLFKVAIDIASYTDSDNSEDLDLITLILKNIEPGKDKYDRDQIENIIDFYTLIGKISFETAEQLFMIIEDQHNTYDDIIIDL